jgi:hypothetical protein
VEADGGGPPDSRRAARNENRALACPADSHRFPFPAI